MIRTDQLPTLYGTYRSRYAEWDARKDKIDLVVQGKFNQVDPDEDPIDSRSPNLIQVALEDTTEAASIMPTIRVLPFGTGERAKSQAARQERVAVSYFDVSRMDMLITQTVMDQAAMGMAAWVIYPDRDQKVPIIEWRDPRTCYPEPGYRPGEKVKRCMFARKLFMSQLPPAWQMQIALNVTDPGFESAKAHTPLIIVEFMDAEETYVGALWQGGSPSMEAYEPVELERIPNKVGICPVVVGSRITLDREFRGQFDQVVGTLLAHVRLMGMVLDYADQAVYSDVWVKDLIGDMPYGGGAYIELGPQGAIGRVPPAVTSLTIGQDLQTLEDAIHLGGRWPKSRPGEVSQSIASAKFIEAAAGMMNTAIKTYHQILQRMMEQALHICFVTDQKFFPGLKTASGILRNQEFLQEYDSVKDIDLRNRVRVEYGLGLGRDPSQSAVLMLQYAQNNYISKEFVQENIDGLVDVGRERTRLDVEKLSDMAFAKLLQGLQDGSIPQDALVKIAQARENGEGIFALIDKFVVQPAAQAGAGQLASGLGGGPVMPGRPGPGGGPALPPGPPGQPGGGGAPALSPPPPPAVTELMSRLNLPVGPSGSKLGVQTTVG